MTVIEEYKDLKVTTDANLIVLVEGVSIKSSPKDLYDLKENNSDDIVQETTSSNDIGDESLLTERKF